MAFLETAEKALPLALRPRAGVLLRQLATILTDRGEHAIAQRMALIAFVIRIVSAAIAFLSQIIQARIMGEFEYGIFVFVWVLTILIGNMSCLGFHSVVLRFLPQYRTEGAHGALFGIAVTARIFSMGLATLVAIAGLVALYLLGSRIETYYIIPVFLALFILPMIALGDVLDGTARANTWAVTALSPTFIIRPTLILVFMLLAVEAGYPKTAVTAMLASMLATYVTSIGQLLTVATRMRRRYPRSVRQYDFLPWLKVALPIFFIEGFGYLLTNSDVVIVGFYLDPKEVGIYFAATKTMALVQFVFFSVKAAAAPRFSTLVAEDDRIGLARFAGEMARWGFWPSLGVGAIMLIVGHFLLSLFGPAFTVGYPLMGILFCGYLAKSSVGPGEVLLTMAGKQRLCALLYAVALLTNLSLNMVLIPYLGLKGAAMAAAGAMMVEALMLHVAVRRTLGIVLFVFADPMPRLVSGKAC
nr:lipopolysaccharide biosynthesis protein [uncultured Gellertiella sp.]